MSSNPARPSETPDSTFPSWLQDRLMESQLFPDTHCWMEPGDLERPAAAQPAEDEAPRSALSRPAASEASPLEDLRGWKFPSPVSDFKGHRNL